MIITKSIKLKITKMNINHIISKGYDVKLKDIIEIKPEDLSRQKPKKATELDSKRFREGMDILNIQNILFKISKKEINIDFEDQGLFSNGVVVSSKYFIDISIKIFKIAKKINEKTDENIILRATKI